MKPWSASIGAQKTASAKAPVRVTAVARTGAQGVPYIVQPGGRGVSPRAGSRRPRRRAARRPDHRARGSSASARAAPLRRPPPAVAPSRCAAPMTTGTSSGSASSGTMQVARAGLDGQRADERPDRPRCPDRRAASTTTRRAAAPAVSAGSSSRIAKAGHRDELDARPGTCSSVSALATQQRACGRRAPAGTPSKPPSSWSATNSRLAPSIAANSSVTHEDAGREVALDVAGLQREVEDDERRDAEQRHRRDDCGARRSSSRSLRSSAADRRLTGRAPRSLAGVDVGRGGEQVARARRAARAPGRPRPGPPAGSWLVTTRVRPERAADERLEQLGRGGVEVGARLVEQQQLGVVQDRAADRDALHHAARVACGPGRRRG